MCSPVFTGKLMTENPLPKRRSTRLKDYDYSQNGAYFITICVEKRKHLFGKVVDDAMQLNDAGKMVDYWWGELPKHFTGIDTDLYIVMPNHFHGILLLFDNTPDVSVIRIVQWFKTMTTNAYIQGVKNSSWRRFDGHLWQRSFHDHIIRNEQSLQKLREYTLYNAALWAADKFYGE
jgi:putative transposase